MINICLFSVVMCAILTEDVYGPALYMILPSMAPENGTQLADLQRLLPDIQPGLGRTAREQAGLLLLSSLASSVTESLQAMIQLAVLGITLAFAVVGGLITGYIIHIDWIFNILKDHELFEDHEFFAGIPTPEPIEDETPTSFNVNNENPLGSI